MPLAILFACFALLGLLMALVGHAAHAHTVAPSMHTNNISPIGYAIFVICGLIAIATALSFR